MTLKEYLVVAKEGQTVMISQPMRGKSEAQIRRERMELEELLAARNDVVVDTVLTDTISSNIKNAALVCLGESLKIMAKCDAVVFMPGWNMARGCILEHQAAKDYGLLLVEMS